MAMGMNRRLLALLLVIAAPTACDEGEILAPPMNGGELAAALVQDDGNAAPSVLVGDRTFPIPAGVLQAAHVKVGEATRIRLVVAADGKLASATLLESCGDAALDARAMAAVKARTFEPGHEREFVTSVWLRPAARR